MFDCFSIGQKSKNPYFSPIPLPKFPLILPYFCGDFLVKSPRDILRMSKMNKKCLKMARSAENFTYFVLEMGKNG